MHFRNVLIVSMFVSMVAAAPLRIDSGTRDRYLSAFPGFAQKLPQENGGGSGGGSEPYNGGMPPKSFVKDLNLPELVKKINLVEVLGAKKAAEVTKILESDRPYLGHDSKVEELVNTLGLFDVHKLQAAEEKLRGVDNSGGSGGFFSGGFFGF